MTGANCCTRPFLSARANGQENICQLWNTLAPLQWLTPANQHWMFNQPSTKAPRDQDLDPPCRKQVTNIIQQVDTEATLQQLRQLSIRGRWLEWTESMNLDLSLRRLFHGIDNGELHFTFRAITNTVPTQDNLRRWDNMTIDNAYVLCGRRCTLRHVLNCCSTTQTQERFT